MVTTAAEIAIAVVREGDEPDEATAGGRFAAPVGKAILQTYFDKKQHMHPTSFAAGEP